MSEEITCPSCGMTIYDDDALLCHYCGESLHRNSSQALGKMRSAGMKWIIITIVVMIIVGFLFIL